MPVIKYPVGIRLAVCLGLLLLGGCNDEVFLDGPILPASSEYTLEGDGGEISFKSTLDQLSHITLSPKQWIKPDRLSYLNAAGDTVSADASPSDIARIVYQTGICCLEILREGDRFTVRSLSNATGVDLSWQITFHYQFGEKTVGISTRPGAPLRLLDISYGTIFDAGGFSDPSRLYVDNQSSDTPFPISIYPFLNRTAVINIEPDVSWLHGAVISIPVPVCDQYGVWTLSGSRFDIEIGSSVAYDGPDQSIVEEVIVPPRFVGVVETSVLYGRGVSTGTLELLNQALDTRLSIHFTAHATYPYSYTPVALFPD